MPKVAEVGLVSTPPQFGWFGRLKNSARNCPAFFSLKRKDLNSAPFQFWKPTLLKPIELRFWFGSVPLAGLVAQAEPPTCGLNQKSVTRRLGLKCGRWRLRSIL